jgi:hypothetical protein
MSDIGAQIEDAVRDFAFALEQRDLIKALHFIERATTLAEVLRQEEWPEEYAQSHPRFHRVLMELNDCTGGAVNLKDADHVLHELADQLWPIDEIENPDIKKIATLARERHLYMDELKVYAEIRARFDEQSRDYLEKNKPRPDNPFFIETK